ncbi:MAG: hypothetical protein HC840_00495 [Leptolyngbyaceae cyanobacterium RM2_2_4]|nr:hypothetical protein [Leptolyngbyaceae cyanobacterium RM2_2_4]
MRALNSNILIVSVFQLKLSQALSHDTHREVLTALQDSGVPVLELQGRYNGVNELSILVDGFEHRATVERIAKTFNQECYLESHNDRATFLVYPDGRRESIGTLVGVSKHEAETVGSYSYNPLVDQYFVTR